MREAHAFDLQAVRWDSLITEAEGLLEELFPICRSITGDGVRKTLARLAEVAEFDIKEIPSNTVCYDWVVPPEWNITAAYVKDSSGSKIIDFAENNLHLVSYSVPIRETMTYSKLEKHLHYLPEMPNAIPYRTSYYDRDWGFCLPYEQFQRLDKTADYEVVIDSSLTEGSMTYGEAFIQGQTNQEFLISTYCCHPSLANDNLTGPILWTLMLRELRTLQPLHSYRFIIVPETIGAIAYLAQNEEAMKALAGAFIPTTVAGPDGFGYKQSFLGDHLIDRVVRRTYEELDLAYTEYPFDINGSDEAHYSSPYFRIPVGTICKSKYYEYDNYHTSLDNLDFVSAEFLVDSLKLYLLAIEKLEINSTFRSLNPYSEAMFGKRGLYPKLGGHIKQKAVSKNIPHSDRQYKISTDQSMYGNELDAMRWLMFYGDGNTPILDISEHTKIPVRQLFETAKNLEAHGLLKNERG